VVLDSQRLRADIARSVHALPQVREVNASGDWWTWRALVEVEAQVFELGMTTLEFASPHSSHGFVARARKHRCDGQHTVQSDEGILDGMSSRDERPRPVTARLSAAAAEGV